MGAHNHSRLLSQWHDVGAVSAHWLVALLVGGRVDKLQRGMERAQSQCDQLQRDHICSSVHAARHSYHDNQHQANLNSIYLNNSLFTNLNYYK